jgi:hypothetical protein
MSVPCPASIELGVRGGRFAYLVLEANGMLA